MGTPLLIAYYLPQFYPIKENDAIWGKGFTEWTNVARAKPLFRGHEQPKIPADLGFYDLRLPEAREAQAALAKEYGISGFCYWHYWFGDGRRLLDLPFREVVASGSPDFPFCLAWANHSWTTKTWTGATDNTRKMIMEQTYPGEADIIDHFYALLPAFRDKRYIRIEGRLVFTIYSPMDHPQMKQFITIWQELAEREKLGGFFFIGHIHTDISNELVMELGFDAVNTLRLGRAYSELVSPYSRILRKFRSFFIHRPPTLAYDRVVNAISSDITERADVFPMIFAGWDHTPRSGVRGLVLTGFDRTSFSNHVCRILNSLKNKPESRRVAFIKAWNEWGEGNYMEPDLKHGREKLEVIQSALSNWDK